jgi:anti-sigma factor RsiW
MNDNERRSDVPSLDEDLVAYLDGELDDPASRRLEERLASDESARERLRALATSWNLLDHLPRAALDEAFTRTTVELLVAEARQEIAAEQAAIPVRQRRRWIVGAAAGLAAAMVGFIAVFVAWPNENEKLLRDLPVVKNLELYDVTPKEGALEFLRQLDELFVEDVTGDIDQLEWATSTESVSDDELDVRRDYVESLPPPEKNELRKLYEKFQARSEEEKDRLRTLDAELRADPQKLRLRAVLESYHNWLPTLSPLERANLLKMTPTDAVAQIEKLKTQQLDRYHRMGRSRQGPLTLEDVKNIEQWLQDRVWKRREEILANANPDDRVWFEGLAESRKKRALMILAGEPWPPKPTLNKEEWEDLLGQLPTVKSLFAARGNPAEMDKLLKQFSQQFANRPAVQRDIKEDVSRADSMEEQQRLLFRWNEDMQRARMAAGGGVPPEELNRFLQEELGKKERDELLALTSPEEFHRRLRWAYFKRDFPPGWQPPFRRGGWGRGKGEGRGPGDGEHHRFDGNHRGGRADFDRRRDHRNDDDDGDRGRSRNPPSGSTED